MKNLSLFLALSILSMPALADRLDQSQIQYLGAFDAPPNQGPGNENTWNYGLGGLTLIPDCLGQADPTPGDGYPGCIGAFGHVSANQFGVFDIVPPGNRAQQVVPFYELGSPIAEQQVGSGGSYNYWDVLYDKGPGHCRLWWTYATYYVNIESDPPFLGVSDCSPGAPDPYGVWDFGEEDAYPDIQDDPFHTAKMFQGLSLIPNSIADQHFDGKEMMLGISRRSGTRGGSQGPSMFVRELELPTFTPPGPVLDATALVWYRLTGFVQWYDDPEMSGPVVDWWTLSRAYGAEFIRVGNSETAILPWREAIIDPLDYPCSDPFAYRDEDPSTPNPCDVPVCWYGVADCREGPAPEQQPSFWEDTSNGESMPADCNIDDECDGGTGMHCRNLRPSLILYDVDELEAVYRGQQPRDYPQPYAKIPLEDFWIDGRGCGSASAGSTYDSDRNLIYISQSKPIPVVHVFSVGGSSSSYTLTMNMSGAGFGRVISSPAGIDCGSDCSAVYPEQTVVDLSAVAEPGSEFIGWWGPSDCIDGTVSVDSDITCSATFALTAPAQSTLSVAKIGSGTGTVTSDPAGINCGDDCDEPYDAPTVIELTATPDSGSIFDGWSGDSDCVDGQVSLDQNTACVAIFISEDSGCSDSDLVKIEDWSSSPETLYAFDPLAPGQLVYTDRSFQTVSFDSELAGSLIIQTANADKHLNLAQHLFLTLCKDAQVSVAYDQRASSLPDWLEGPAWVEVETALITDDIPASPMRILRASFPAGPVVLGGNHEGGHTGASSNYVVIIQQTPAIFSDGLEDGETSSWSLSCDGTSPGEDACQTDPDD